MTILIRDEQNTLDTFDKIMLNGCKVIATQELNAKLLQKNAMFNGCNTTVIQTPRNPVYAQGRITLDNDNPYAGKYLICNDAIVTLDSLAALETMEGLYVMGTLYHPQSLPQSAFSNTQASHFVLYPDDALLVFENETHLTAANAANWKANTHYCLLETLFATDSAALNALSQRNVRFDCDTLYICENDLEAHHTMFTYANLEIIPAGYTLISNTMSLTDLYANGGERIYLLHGLTITPRDVKNLTLFTSIVAKGTVTLPFEALAEGKRVIQTNRFKPLKGS